MSEPTSAHGDTGNGVGSEAIDMGPTGTLMMSWNDDVGCWDGFVDPEGSASSSAVGAPTPGGLVLAPFDDGSISLGLDGRVVSAWIEPDASPATVAAFDALVGPLNTRLLSPPTDRSPIAQPVIVTADRSSLVDSVVARDQIDHRRARSRMHRILIHLESAATVAVWDELIVEGPNARVVPDRSQPRLYRISASYGDEREAVGWMDREPIEVGRGEDERGTFVRTLSGDGNVRTWRRSGSWAYHLRQVAELAVGIDAVTLGRQFLASGSDVVLTAARLRETSAVLRARLRNHADCLAPMEPDGAYRIVGVIDELLAVVQPHLVQSNDGEIPAFRGAPTLVGDTAVPSVRGVSPDVLEAPGEELSVDHGSQSGSRSFSEDADPVADRSPDSRPAGVTMERTADDTLVLADDDARGLGLATRVRVEVAPDGNSSRITVKRTGSPVPGLWVEVRDASGRLVGTAPFPEVGEMRSSRVVTGPTRPDHWSLARRDLRNLSDPGSLPEVMGRAASLGRAAWWLARSGRSGPAEIMFARAAIEWLSIGLLSRAAWAWSLSDRGTVADGLGSDAADLIGPLDTVATYGGLVPQPQRADVVPVPLWACASTVDELLGSDTGIRRR